VRGVPTVVQTSYPANPSRLLIMAQVAPPSQRKLAFLVVALLCKSVARGARSDIV
jgi:hypothetical protein